MTEPELRRLGPESESGAKHYHHYHNKLKTEEKHGGSQIIQNPLLSSISLPEQKWKQTGYMYVLELPCNVQFLAGLHIA